MQKNLAEIEAAGISIVGVSYDSQETLEKFAEQRKITFPLLSDPDSKTIEAYSLRNKEAKGKSFGKIKVDGVPYPGTVIVGTNRQILAKLFVDGYRERHSVAELIETAKSLKKSVDK